MGSTGRMSFDLNELPTEESDCVSHFQSQKALLTLNSNPPDFAASVVSQRIANNNAFSHVSSVSGFQPFVKPKGNNGSELCLGQKMTCDQSSKSAFLYNFVNVNELKNGQPLDLSSPKAEAVEKGEWSDAEGCKNAPKSSSASGRLSVDYGKVLEQHAIDEVLDTCASVFGNGPTTVKIIEFNKDDITCHKLLKLEPDPCDKKSNGTWNSEGDVKDDSQGEHKSGLKQKEVKGVETSRALKCASTLGKRQKIDEQKGAMLGKKRGRQTMFIDLQNAKQAVTKASTPRRKNFPVPVTTRTVKENQTVPPLPEQTVEK